MNLIKNGNSVATLRKEAARLANGELTAQDMVAAALARADAADARIWTQRLDELALRTAEEIDRKRAAGEPPGLFAGVPIAVKDLFDLAGTETWAGSRVLRGQGLATRTAPAIQRLLDQGLIPIGKTNMTEFAYSGLGINPHYGTPANPADSAIERIPGGSSSGSAAAVAAGVVCAAIGTDTGGSVRIPSSLCGLTGLKPAAAAIPADALVPLSTTLDSIGPLANSVQCCADLHAIMSGQAPRIIEPLKQRLKIMVPENVVRDSADNGILERFDAALDALEAAGVASLDRVRLPLFDELVESGVQGIIASHEAWQWHQQLVERDAESYDPRVLIRLQLGAKVSDAQYHDALRIRNAIMARFREEMSGCDALLIPTTVIPAPPLHKFNDDEFYQRSNYLMLRNTSLGNSLDCSATSLPLAPTVASPLPAGLMVMRPGGEEWQTLAVSRTIEQVLGAAA